MDEHNKLVGQIARNVKDFYDKKQKFRIFRGATNSSRNQALLDRKNVVDTSGLNHVLKVDTDNLLIYVEANVPMDRLVEATLFHGLTPAVVADFPGKSKSMRICNHMLIKLVTCRYYCWWRLQWNNWRKLVLQAWFLQSHNRSHRNGPG